MADGYWKGYFKDVADDYFSAPQNGLLLPLISNAFGRNNDSADIKSSVSAQDSLNRFAINSAKQVWEKQAEADKLAMQFTHDENELAWQREIEASNTAYQRAVADMRKAGLNPALMFANGSAASTPSSSGGSGISSARQAAQLNLENVVKDFKVLLRELEQSGENAKTAAEAQKYSANVNAITRVFEVLSDD